VNVPAPPLPRTRNAAFLPRHECRGLLRRFVERDDVDYIMETFPNVKRKDEKLIGEYRTKCVILEMSDEMRRAMEIEYTYRTRLEPPPADAAMGH
jgi:hypothetical protein